MKKLILIFPALLMLGCSVQQDCCETDNLQCDEMYPYYNCSLEGAYSYTPRNYAKHIRNMGNSIFYVGSHYVAPQRVACTAIQELATPPLNNGNVVLNTRRPERLGAMGETRPKPVTNNIKRTRE